MRAMILAAGVGSRLDPLTRSVPKPMVPIVNAPAMEHLVRLLRDHGFTEIAVNLHYLADQIHGHFGDGQGFGVNITYSHEEQLWGDAGSLKRLQPFFDDTFLVISGDAVTDIDLAALIRYHRANAAFATIGLSAVDDTSQYGIALQNERGRIIRFQEKPDAASAFSNTANTGIYVFDPTVFDLIPAGERFGLGRHVLPSIMGSGLPFFGYLTDAYWKDVGDLDAYRQTQLDAMEGKVRLQFPLSQERERVWIGENCELHPTATLEPPVMIGHGCRVLANARVLAGTVLGDRCIIEENAELRRSLLWEDAVVSAGTRLDGCILDKSCRVRSTGPLVDEIVVSGDGPVRQNTL